MSFWKEITKVFTNPKEVFESVVEHTKDFVVDVGQFAGETVKQSAEKSLEIGKELLPYAPTLASGGTIPPIPLTGTLTPTPSTPPIVAPAQEIVTVSPEGVQEVDSWAWTQKLMEIRQQIAAVEVPKLVANQSRTVVTQPQSNLIPLILLGGIGYLVIENVL